MDHSVFTYPRDEFEANGINGKAVYDLIKIHKETMRDRLEKNLAYYLGHHAISDSDVESKTVCNHAKDISDVASGYFLGSAISYRVRGEDTDGRKEAAKTLVDTLNDAEVAETDNDNSLNGSIFGLAHDYTYALEGETALMTKAMSPLDTFVVVDQSIEQRELFGVNYYQVANKESQLEDGYTYALVTTDKQLMYFKFGDESYEPYRVEDHYLGFVPITEYRNNKFCIGDFEQVIGLIDAYNDLTSCRIIDKKQYIDSILVIYGSLLGSDEESSEEAMEELKEKKLLELDEDAKAQYLTNTLDEGGTEVLRKALKQDIYTLAHVPNFSDENFAGNSSGVAMEFKLLSLEMLTKTKESWYRKGLKKRLKMFLHYLEVKQGIKLNLNEIEINFSRGLPRNLLELSQIAVNLDGKVTRKTLLSMMPFVENPEAEVEELDKEAEKSEETKLKAQGLFNNNPPPMPDETDPEGGEEDELNE